MGLQMMDGGLEFSFGLCLKSMGTDYEVAMWTQHIGITLS